MGCQLGFRVSYERTYLDLAAAFLGIEQPEAAAQMLILLLVNRFPWSLEIGQIVPHPLVVHNLATGRRRTALVVSLHERAPA